MLDNSHGPAKEFIEEVLNEVAPPSEPPMEAFVESIINDIVEEYEDVEKPAVADFIEAVL